MDGESVRADRQMMPDQERLPFAGMVEGWPLTSRSFTGHKDSDAAEHKPWRRRAKLLFSPPPETLFFLAGGVTPAGAKWFRPTAGGIELLSNHATNIISQ